jgi:hypothetical protein
VKLVSGIKLGGELCEKLGLDPARVLSMKIVLVPNELVHVDVETLMDVEVEGEVEQFIETHTFHAAETP